MTTNTIDVNLAQMLFLQRHAYVYVYGDGHESVPSEPAFLYTAASQASYVERLPSLISLI
ncbi:hypothetical protein ACN9MH_03475 [Paenibacillus silvae]|uniref:hypothetical protein n=1 Tax=Paenibacillus TaxID=44249 RepID=UPI001C11EEC3|nr:MULTISPECIES: hypothetical protein [Paenibacillus]MBU5355923.1 hypothetical protein [Paenibacillus barcinonensis]MDM5280006.1 hypothetical protein [Paenibacillus silvae]